jgi:transcriptional regulator with XRE-family HTH domain
MKNILADLRQWLGLSQSEMAAVLGVSRSLYSMAELGKRDLDPEISLQIIALYQHMQNATPFEGTLAIEESSLQNFLNEEVEKEELLAFETKVKQRMQKYAERFPERNFELPEEIEVDNSGSGLFWYLILQKTETRLYRYQYQFEKKLKSELELVSTRAKVEYLRNKLNSRDKEETG